MKEYQIGCAVVRIHGNTDHDNLKASTEKFMKKVIKCKKKQKKEKSKIAS